MAEMDAKNRLETTIKKLVAFTPAEWKDFVSHWEPLSIKKNDFLTQAGQVEKYFYFVSEGVLRAYILKEGEEICIGFSYDTDFSGAYDSFLAQEPTDIYIQAISGATLLRIHYTNLMHMFDKYKSAERWGRQFNANILIGMARRQLETRSFSAEERFDRLMRQSPHIMQLVPQKYLASYLGMTPETFSRLRKKKMDNHS